MRMPSAESLTYWRLFLSTLLLALALPLLLMHFWRDPQGAGKRLAGGGLV